MLTNPYLLLLAFFDGTTGRQTARRWGQQFATRLGVRLLRDGEEADTPDSPHICRLYDQHDATVIWISSDLEGSYSSSCWQQLSDTMFGADHAIWLSCQNLITEAQQTRFWGTSLIFGAELASYPPENDILAPLATIPLLPGSQPLVTNSPQAWGQIYQLTGQSSETLSSSHTYVVLSKPDTEPQINDFVFRRHRLDLIELSLHKAYHQLQSHRQSRDTLHHYILELDRASAHLLQEETPTKQHVLTISKQYAAFAKQASQVMELQNTVVINQTNYVQLVTKLELYNAEDTLFATHTQQIEHGLAQIKADQVYYNAAMERLKTGLETVRTKFEWQSNEAWRQFLKANEARRQEEEKRDQGRNLMIGIVGALLGLVEVVSILDHIVELYYSDINGWELGLRLFVNLGCMGGIVLLVGLVGVWVVLRRRE